MEIPPLLRPSYWFNPTPPPFVPTVERGLLVVFGAFVFIGILGRIVTLRPGWEKFSKRLVIRSADTLAVFGAFGLLLLGLAYERIPVLGARGWYLVWAAWFAWEIWKISRYALVEIPELERKRTEREAQEKWLPKPKT
ncbi:hypothetical protein HY479_00170 [Candidatus Uhrbacteria bacterium]|nr:hypothetical protein [Candidatus Uhrbacteria bacterium]